MGFGIIFGIMGNNIKQRAKDMQDNKNKVVFQMNIREQRQRENCGCGGNCHCNGSTIKRRELNRKESVSKNRGSSHRRETVGEKARRFLMGMSTIHKAVVDNDIIDDIDMKEFKGDI
jgi:hypothetical protein